MKKIICISGLVGSGKDTVADRVAKKLKFGRVKLTFKDIAKKMGMPLMEYHRYVEKDLSIDREFDKRVLEEALKENCVVSTWLGAWLIKEASLRVWLECEENERARRVAKRDGITYKKALKHIRERDTHNRGRYLALYGIDILDHRDFDLIINTAHYNPEQTADIIVAAFKAKMKK